MCSVRKEENPEILLDGAGISDFIGAGSGRSLFNGFSQFGAGLELDDLASFDLNLFLGLGVDSLTCRTFIESKSSKPEKCYLVALFQCVRYGAESGVKRFLGVCLAQPSGCNGVDEICFVHIVDCINVFVSGVWCAGVLLNGKSSHGMLHGEYKANIGRHGELCQMFFYFFCPYRLKSPVRAYKYAYITTILAAAACEPCVSATRI